MKKYSFSILLACLGILFLCSFNLNAQTQRKLAQTGLKFLSVSTDARVSGMGDAFTSVFNSSTAMLYNPAGMAELNRTVDVSFGQTKWIADIDYTHATVAFTPFGSNIGVFGISVVAVDYGSFQGTIRSDNASGYLDIGTFSPSALSVGISYATKLSEKFGIGANIKYARQSLIDNGIVGITATGGYEEEKFEIDVMSFDFGLIYKTGFKSLNIGMSVRNFSQEIKYIEENFQLPLTFKLGVSMNMLDIWEIEPSRHSFLLSVDAATPRDFEEQVFIGGEYVFLNTFSLRAGYTTPTDEAGIAFGFGLKHELAGVFVSADYSYTEFGIFDNTHRFGFSIAY